MQDGFDCSGVEGWEGRTCWRPSVRRWNAGRPVRSSKAITPSAHMSAEHATSQRAEPPWMRAVSYARMTSGDAYVRVKHTVVLSPARAAQPKSMTVHRFSRGSHMTLEGLRSRCT